jgi:hypothetical protein
MPFFFIFFIKAGRLLPSQAERLVIECKRYDGVIIRLSASGKTENPQTWNRFAYVLSNPPFL